MPHRQLVAGDVPEVADLLTMNNVRADIIRSVQHRQHVAADPRLLTQWHTGRNDEQILTIQHQRSGLRARFTPGDDGVGAVYSKPYNIGSQG